MDRKRLNLDTASTECLNLAEEEPVRHRRVMAGQVADPHVRSPWLSHGRRLAKSVSSTRSVCGIVGVSARRAPGDRAIHGDDVRGSRTPRPRLTRHFSTTRRGSGCSGSGSSTSRAGDQPIYNEDGSIVVVLNGEIYNYRELRAELLRPATVLDGLRHRGDRPPLRGFGRVRPALRGMFAFAVVQPCLRRASARRARARPG